MEKRQIQIDIALHEFGQRLREGAKKLQPVQEKSLDTARAAVREEWEKEQELNHSKLLEPEHGREPEPEQDKGMDMER